MSRAGTSTTPASEAGMLPAASTPFAWPDSHAGLAPQKHITTVIIIIYERPTDAGGREHVSQLGLSRH